MIKSIIVNAPFDGDFGLLKNKCIFYLKINGYLSNTVIIYKLLSFYYGLFCFYKSIVYIMYAVSIKFEHLLRNKL